MEGNENARKITTPYKLKYFEIVTNVWTYGHTKVIRYLRFLKKAAICFKYPIIAHKRNTTIRNKKSNYI